VQPLSGYKVLACENGLAGPLCSRLLADLGADVVKIERPEGGDVTRAWDTGAKGLSSGFVWVNRGKRSVTLDLRRPQARAALERLVERSDVFLVNFTHGWAERFGLDEAAVRRLRPDIVYTEITGYGTDGPYAAKNAYDLVVQGEAGLIALGGTEDEPARVAIPVCDLGAGSYAAIGTLAALLRRAVSGQGERVSVSLFDVMIDWIGYYPHFFWHRGETPKRTGMRHPLFVPYGPHRSGDGKLVNLAVLSAEHWRAFCLDVLERSDLYEDERYATMEGRVAHRRELEPAVEAAFLARPASEWLERLERAGIPCGAVNELPDVMRHPQLAHNRLVTEIGSPVGPIPSIGSPIALDGERPELGPVPALGEHTREVLAELGLPDEQVRALLAPGS
jgi:crotonobetainyl-CoA:carnitine CoA-transferase CaiB-like acyl-CoA transferase